MERQENSRYTSDNPYYGNPYGLNNGYSNAAFDNNDKNDSIDWKEWALKFLRYWYLFVIAILIALCAAYLKNRSWLPTYQTTGTILIEEYGSSRMSYGTQSLLQGFGVDPGYRNINNQVIMLGSYDLLCEVVDSLPFMAVDYMTIGRFRTRNIYTNTPILVETTRIHPDAYNKIFHIKLNPDGTYEVSIFEDEEKNDFLVKGKYGEPVNSSLMDFSVFPTQNMLSNGQLYFRLRSRESLVADFSSRLTMSFLSEGSSVLAVSLVSATPARDKDFIDKLFEVYLADNLSRKNDVANNTIKFIDSQLEVIAKALEVSESAMTHFRQQNQIVDVSSHAGDILGKATQYDANMADIRLKETYLDYLTDYLKTNLENGSVVAPSSLGLSEPMLMTLIQQLNDLNMQRNELSQKNVFYEQYSKDMDNVKKAIMEVVKNMRVSLDIEKADLNQRYNAVKKEIELLPEKELEMVAIERAYRIDDNYYTFFLQKRAEAEIQKASNTPDNKILDKARTLSVTNTSARRKVYTMFLLLGVILPALFVLLKELLNPKVRSVKELNRLSDYPFLGGVRHTRSQNPVLPIENPKSSYAEMLRAIRTRIEFIVQRKDKISILVSSSQSGDGKTFFSCNLATIYAMTGKKVILVDMDIRKPDVATKLQMEGVKGVTNYLIGEATLEEVIRKNEKAGFDVIFAGTIPPNPGELVRSAKLNDMFTHLKEEYDFIIIDTSPLGLVSDAYPLIEQTDVNLFIVRSHKTNKSICRYTLEQLQTDNVKLYTVFVDMPIDVGHYYGGRYGYYSKKDAKQYTHYYHDDDVK